MSERAHAAAWRAALETPLDQWSAYDYDDVPDTLPAIYVLISVTRRFGGDRSLGGRLTRKGWRLTTRYVGRTVDEARWARERIGQLEDTSLAAIDADGLRFESDTPPEDDGGRYSGIAVWTYATPA